MFPGKRPEDTKIVVAMSGGVDSSTVAALLHEQKYQIIGVTLQLYDYDMVAKKGACCAGQDIYDAQMVASKLNIPHYVLNYESLFKKEVIEEFADSYIRGETPIPCVKCNQTVKFRDLLKVAQDLGADGLATGHYVQKKIGKKRAELHKGADYLKDQSYFLFGTTYEQLEYLDFPLGHLSKAETRQLAEKFELKVADKPDSQDICFVPNGSYVSVIERFRPGALEPGEIIHIDGTVLGKHEGIINYTIGQRRNIKVNSNEALYVVKIDASNKKIIVGPYSALGRKKFIIKDVNWLGEELDEQEKFSVKMRSGQSPTTAKIRKIADNKMIIELDEAQNSITAGQACVIYLDSRVLGGGWIARSEEEAELESNF